MRLSAVFLLIFLVGIGYVTYDIYKMIRTNDLTRELEEKLEIQALVLADKNPKDGRTTLAERDQMNSDI